MHYEVEFAPCLKSIDFTICDTYIVNQPKMAANVMCNEGVPVLCLFSQPPKLYVKHCVTTPQCVTKEV